MEKWAFNSSSEACDIAAGCVCLYVGDRGVGPNACPSELFSILRLFQKGKAMTEENSLLSFRVFYSFWFMISMFNLNAMKVCER